MEILTRVENKVGWVTLNRPAMRNAISKTMWDELPVALKTLRTQRAEVIVITGEGDAFCAGADLVELQGLAGNEDAKRHWLSIRNALNMVASFELPTIAMINGACMGGGCLLACACDMRFCTDEARFSVPVAQLGILLDDDNIARLISLVGRGCAAEMLFTAAVIDAGRAERIGLVNAAVPGAELKAKVLDVAAGIGKNVAGAIAQTKRAINALSRCAASPEQDQSPMIASYLSDEFRARVFRALTKGSTPE